MLTNLAAGTRRGHRGGRAPTEERRCYGHVSGAQGRSIYLPLRVVPVSIKFPWLREEVSGHVRDEVYPQKPILTSDRRSNFLHSHTCL